MKLLKERFIKIPKAKYLSKQRRKLKCRHRKLNRHEYRLRCTEINFKVPYLRFSLNPFSIAFLILVIFSSDVWPHTKSSFHVSCSPIHFRHYNHRMLTAHVNPNSSKSDLKSNKLSNFVNSSNSYVVSNNYFSTLRKKNIDSGRMFLKPNQFRKRFGRSSKQYEFSPPSRDEPRTRSSSKSFKSSSSSWPPCSHVGDAVNEISARTYVADTVFEGKVRSKSTIKDPIGKYGVTFVVQHVYKDQSNGQNVMRPKTQVRLFFIEKSIVSNATKPTAHCVQKYNYPKRQGDLPKANIKRGRRYIVFVNRIAPHNYTIIGEPVPKSKKNEEAVKSVLCRNCVKQINVEGLENKTAVKLGEELRLMCRIQGTPLPALQWFKDGAPIIVTSRLRIQYKKKRSVLVIPEVRNSDSGKYECRALGVQSINPVSRSSIVTVDTRFENITSLWPLEGKPCPTNVVYCLNGGTCTYYETIGELTCQCADGFNGGRCENKDVVNSNSIDGSK